jgi:cytochrome c-type biogenesis protein CcmH/NrfG
VWQPLRSSDQVSAAIDALTRGDTEAALADANNAAASDPVSVEPLWELSAIYGALGDKSASRRELLKAVQLQPSNAQTWAQLASFDLRAHSGRQLVLVELQIAVRLDRTSPIIQQLIDEADKQPA